MIVLMIPALAGLLACHDLSGLAGTQALPSGTPDPSVYHTAAGALALYQSALDLAQGDARFEGAFVDAMFHSGLLSDELQAGDLGCPAGNACGLSREDNEDARQLSEGVSNPTDVLYGELQAVRGTAAEAIGALAAYDDSAPSALSGQLHAVQGYTELYLADLFCSGVPLSRLNFTGTTSYTYAAGSTTAQLYQDAIAQFDTALSLALDSARIMNLARVGKGRALLALDSVPQAAAAVSPVPNGFTYNFNVAWNGGVLFEGSGAGGVAGPVTVADGKGRNGLRYLSSDDPRVASQVRYTNAYGVPQYVAVKYGGGAPSSAAFTVADWIEARLIQAEAALRGIATGQGSWLDQLNALRQTAITPALPPLTDPGNSPGDSARVSLLFQERAYWLFLTGHRLGDLRRRVRQYDQSVSQVFPIGPYPGVKVQTFYDPETLTAPVPPTESVNSLYHGCLSRGA